MAADSASWLVNLTKRQDPQLLLFAIPHAGGGPHAYAGWPHILPEHVELIAASLPGRGARLAEPPLEDIQALADQLSAAILQAGERNMPFALFGHSLGSLVGFEVPPGSRPDRVAAGGQTARGGRPPAGAPGEPLPWGGSWPAGRQVASAHAAPSHAAVPESEWLHAMPDGALIDELLRRGWMAERPAPELLPVLLPALRADLMMHDKYQTSTHRLGCPVAVMGGADDLYVARSALEGWQAHGAGGEVEMFPGGHFYTETCQPQLLERLAGLLQAALAGLPRSVLTGPALKLPETRLVHQLFEAQAERTPDRTAIEYLNHKLTYRELSERSTLLARHLQGAGATGSSVGVFMKKCPEYMIGCLAIFKAGCSMLLIETNYTGYMITELLEATGTTIVLTLDELRPNLPSSAITEAVAVDTPWYKPGAELPELKHIAVGLDEQAYVTMTSGSTGKPKAVANTHRGALLCFLSRPYPYAKDRQEREALNVFFAWECLRPLLFGHTAVVIDDVTIMDPKKLAYFIRDKQITRLMTTPSLLEAMLSHPKLDLARAFATIKHWYLEGEAVPSRVLSKWHPRVATEQRFSLVNYYSSWESLDATCCTLDPIEDPKITAGAPAPAGHVLANTQVFIVDSFESCVPVPRGVPGEVLVSSNILAIGYLGDPEKTAMRFKTRSIGEGKPVRVYHTGDRGRVLTDGRLQILGRGDSTVKIRGFKVGLPFVETAIKALPDVALAAVEPVKDQNGTVQNLCAYVVLEAGDKANEAARLDALKECARGVLPEYAMPLFWMVLDEMPMKQGESRKLDRQKLPAPPTQQAKVTMQPDKPTVSQPESGSRIQQVVMEAWKAALGHSFIDPEANFFEIGGHSLLAGKVVADLSSKFGLAVSVLDLYDNPTVSRLAARFGPKAATRLPVARRSKSQQAGVLDDVAIIGMAGKFPGSDDIQSFWSTLLEGKDMLRRFSREELLAKGVSTSLLDNPNYVMAGQVVNDADKFDAGFWGISRGEATIMDPQHRVFLEVAWAAVENAGYAPRTGTRGGTDVGVFASCGIDGYLIHHLEGGALKQPDEPGLLFLTEVGSEKDYIATRVSYMMDIGGPSVNVQSACSSGLIAVAQAAQAIRAGTCDMAIAGASSLSFPNQGYFYQEGLVSSPDGHVRPFDQKAAGTLFGDAVCAVVLKRLPYAVEDGDNILCVLKGYGISNDGALKAGYSAPSATGQKHAIVAAMKMASMTASDMSYVECHATGTNIGDGIEMRGLADAYQEIGGGTGHRVAIGSVKGNIGHANCAAGMTGLIKAILCIKNRQLVPTAHFSKLSTKLDLANTPFYVNEGVNDFNGEGNMVAGVSAFGIGGTNCHLVLEEYTPKATTPRGLGTKHKRQHLLLVSAKSKEALVSNAEALATHLEQAAQNGDLDLTDVAYTLHVGREKFKYSWTVCAQDAVDAAEKLREQASAGTEGITAGGKECSVVFAFPGQGSQYATMGQRLYENEPIFRHYFDVCSDILQDVAGFLLQDELFAAGDSDEALQSSKQQCAQALKRPQVTQPGIFCVEYALGMTLLELGVQPIAMVGHSIGEYTAAVLSGKLQLRDAISIVYLRANTMATKCEAGAMLSVVMDAAAAAEFATSHEGVWLACDNSPQNQVFSVAPSAVDQIEKELQSMEVRCTKLHTTHGFHSDMVAPAAQEVDQFAKHIELGATQIPFTSNVTGEWFGDDCEDAQYWGRHITGTVRFRENVDAILEWCPSVVLEVGPGTTMCALVSKCAKASNQPTPVTLAAMCHPKVASKTIGVVDDEQPFVTAIGKLWSAGAQIDWERYHEGESRQRVPLPSYCFEKLSFWRNPSRSIYVPGGPEADESNQEQAAVGAAPHRAPHKALVEYAPAVLQPWIKLYCFPFAGGSSQLFSSWAKTSPDGVHVVAVELAGRGSRSGEALPASDADDAAEMEAIAEAIQKDVADGTPYCLVGFSMGALMAVRVACLMPRSHRVPGGQLKHMVIAGRAPVGFHMEKSGGSDNVDVEAFAMAPPEVMASEAWESYLLPMLTADLHTDVRNEAQLFGTLQQTPALLTCPISVFCGLEDSAFPREIVHDWASITSSDASYHFLPGEHSFLNDESEAIFGSVCRSLAGYRATTAGPAASTDCSPSHAQSMMFDVAWKPIGSVPMPEHALDVASLALTSSLSDKKSWIEQSCTAEQWLDKYKSAVGSSSGLVLQLVCEPNATLTEALEQDTEQAWALVEFVQQLVNAGAAGRIVMVCPASQRGAMAANASKAVPLEFPEIQVQRVFYDRLGLLESSDLSWISTVAAAYPTESDLLVKPGRRKVAVMAPRLEPAAVAAQPRHAVVYDENSGSEPVFIVTGGMGGVGSAVVDWLVDNQQVRPENVIILSRRAVEVHPRGCRVVQADITDSATLVELGLWDEIDNVAGVLHLAGVLDDGLLTNMTRERMAKVIGPKIAILNLFELVRQMGWAPQYIAGFSSTSSLFGYAGQANYSAANGFMDQLAQWGPGGDLPFLAINWSAWDAGMAAKGTKAYQMSLDNGELPIEIKDGMQCLHHTLSRMLSVPVRQVCVAQCQWAETPWSDYACIASLKQGQQAAAVAQGLGAPDATSSLAEGATEEGDQSAIFKFLEQKVSKWMPSETLSDLGLDSLDTAQMRASFNKQFSLQVGMDVFADPMQTLGQLAAKLQALVEAS